MYIRYCTVSKECYILTRQAEAIVNKTKSLLGDSTDRIFIRKADEKDEKMKADATRIMEVMMLVIIGNTELMVYTENDDLCQAVDELAEFIEELPGV